MNNKKDKSLLTILLVVPIAIISLFFVHILAVLGVFVAVAYPIWWIIFPKKTPCLFCRFSNPGEKCFACREEVTFEDRTPKSFSSLVINFLFILLITCVSVGTVYLENIVLEKMGIQLSETKVEFIIEDKMQYKIGEIFPINLDINSNGVYINAVQTDIGFDPDKVEIEKIDIQQSFANIFIQQEINNEDGYMRLTGGLPSPGYNGEKGHFATVYFKSKAAGLFDIQFLPSSMVLANDGDGTNVLKTYPKTSYLIKPEYVTETEQELQIQMLQASNILGVQEKDNQMLFFDEPNSSVMGVIDFETTSDGDDLANDGTKALSFWQILLIVNEWIIDFFTKLFSFI